MIHDNGSCSIVYFVKPNELIGELTLINIEKQAKDVISIGKSVCLAAYILLCECEGIYNENHVQTAEYLAVSYRHLLYVLKQFKKGAS